MDNYCEKIIHIVERELIRTEEYQQRRNEYGNEKYIWGCIMIMDDTFPKDMIAHAFVEDTGLELRFQIWRNEPQIRQKQGAWYDLTMFDVEGDSFGKLEHGYSIFYRYLIFSIAPLGVQWNQIVKEMLRLRSTCCACWKQLIGFFQHTHLSFFAWA